MSNYLSTFDISDKVSIDGGDVTGSVVEVLFSGADGHRVQVSVSWIANGVPQTGWFDEFRLTRVE